MTMTTTIPQARGTAPNHAKLRQHMIELESKVELRARMGEGLSPADTEQLAKGLREIIRRSPDNDADAGESGRMTPLTAVALAARDLEMAIADLERVRQSLREQISAELAAIDPDNIRLIGRAQSYQLRAQSTLGAVRIAR